MRYRINNIICLTALALILGVSAPADLRAQGVVTLADSAVQDDEALNKDIPNELSLFDDSTGLDELGLPALDSNAPAAAPADPAVPPLPSDTQSGNAAPQMNAPVLPSAANPLPAMASTPENNPLAAEDAADLNTLLSEPGAGIGALGTNSGTVIDDAVFAKMSDLEKQTALLNLELRREKVKNEIEAIKNQRKQAIEQEKEKDEAKKRAKIEWEKAQEQKVLQEQQKLRELDIQFEKLRQEKLLNSYKNKMLEDNQTWIAKDGSLYKEINDLKNEKTEIAKSAKEKINSLKDAISLANTTAIEVRSQFQREIADLHTQLSVLKSRLEAQEKEMEKQNPFAEEGAEAAAMVNQHLDNADTDNKLSDMYAVMEIRGQGGELIAKLLNQDGTPFYVKKGTSLQSGHIIDEITSTYVRADKNGMKDYLYFAAGGILPLEPIKSDIKSNLKDTAGQEAATPRMEFVSSDGVPGLGRDMIAR